MLPDPEPIYSEPFIYLLNGSVTLAQLAHLEENNFGPNTLAHASILNSSFMLEAAANCCIESLQITRRLKDDLDRLPVLAKFETYARIGFSKKKADFFDPGHPAILKVRELKTLRDRLAHPKRLVGQLIWTEWDEKNGGEAYEEYGRYTQLDISKDPSCWGRQDAVKVCRAANEFLDFFFSRKLRYSVAATHRILLGREGDHASVFDFDHVARILEKSAHEHGIPFGYLGVTTSANKPRRDNPYQPPCSDGFP